MTAHRKAVLSPETRAILAHLRSAGARTFSQLQDELAHRYPPNKLRARLRSLVECDWLTRDYTHAGPDSVLCWSIHPLARGAVAQALDSLQAKCDLVPPRAISVMQGDYIHRPLHAARPGALDHTAVASRGQRC